MPKFKVGEEYWQTDKKCYAKYIKENDDRIGGLIVTYRGDLNTYGIDCSLLIDTSHTMLAEIGFEVDGIGDYYCKKGKYKSYVIEVDKEGYLVSNTDYCGYITQPLHEALSQLMREQQ